MKNASLLLVAAGTIANASCARDQTVARGEAPRYKPTTREITITTVPLLVKEEQRVLPFLKEDFAKGGVLDGKEVYAFSPSSVTVIEGDTIHFTLINPEDDVHSFIPSRSGGLAAGAEDDDRNLRRQTSGDIPVLLRGADPSADDVGAARGAAGFDYGRGAVTAASRSLAIRIGPSTPNAVLTTVGAPVPLSISYICIAMSIPRTGAAQ